MGFFALLQTQLGCGWSLTHHSKHSALRFLASFVRAILEALSGGQSSVVDFLCYLRLSVTPAPKCWSVRTREHTTDRRGDTAFPSLPGAVMGLARHLSSLARAPQRTRVLQGAASPFCSGRMSSEGRSIRVAAGAGPGALGTHSGSSTNWKRLSKSRYFSGPPCPCLSDDRLDGDVSRFPSSANVSSRIFAELSQGASGVEVGQEGVGDKQQTLLGRQSCV